MTKLRTRDRSSDTIRVAPKIVRIYPEARSIHLERAPMMAEGQYYYFNRRVDYDESLERQRSRFTRIRPSRLAWRLATDPAVTIVELPEPLWVRYIPHTLLILSAVTLRRLFGRRAPL